MKHAMEKIAKKNNTKSLILSDKEVAEKSAEKKKRRADESDILGANSTSV